MEIIVNNIKKILFKMNNRVNNVINNWKRVKIYKKNCIK